MFERDIIKLNSTQLKVLKLLCEEKTTKQIAYELNFKKNYIDNVRIDLIKKIDCINTIGLVKFAIKNKIYEY